MKKLVLCFSLLLTSIGLFSKEDKSVELQKDLNKYFVGVANPPSQEYRFSGLWLKPEDYSYGVFDTTFTTPGDSALFVQMETDEAGYADGATYLLDPNGFKDTIVHIYCWGGMVDTMMYASYKGWTDTIYPYLRDVVLGQGAPSYFVETPLDYSMFAEAILAVIDTFYMGSGLDMFYQYPRTIFNGCYDGDCKSIQPGAPSILEYPGISTVEGGEFKTLMDTITAYTQLGAQETAEIKTQINTLVDNKRSGQQPNSAWRGAGACIKNKKRTRMLDDTSLDPRKTQVEMFDNDYRMKTGCEYYVYTGYNTPQDNSYAYYNRPFFRTRIYGNLDASEVVEHNVQLAQGGNYSPYSQVGSDRNADILGSEDTTVYTSRCFQAAMNISPYKDPDTGNLNWQALKEMFNFRDEYGTFYADAELWLYIKTFDPANLIFKDVMFRYLRINTEATYDILAKEYSTARCRSWNEQVQNQIIVSLAGCSTLEELLSSKPFTIFATWITRWGRPTDLYDKSDGHVSSNNRIEFNDMIGGMRQSPQSMAYKEFQIKMNQWTNARINSQSYFRTWAELYPTSMTTTPEFNCDTIAFKKVMSDIYTVTGDTVWVTRAKTLHGTPLINVLTGMTTWIVERIKRNDIPLLYYTTDNYTWQREMCQTYLMYVHSW